MTIHRNGIPAVAGMLISIALAMPAISIAQEVERTWIQVREVHVKPGRVNDFVRLQIQLSEALKADGRPGRGVWQEIRGDLATFHIVAPVDDLAELDEPNEPVMNEDDWAEWVAAILDVTESSERTILRSHREWTISPEEGSEPDLLLLRTTTVKPTHMGEYHTWVADKLVPALKKGGAKGVSFNHQVYGGNATTWVVAARLENWAALQRPRGALNYLSDEEYSALVMPAREMTLASDLRILRYRPDISF